MLLFRVKLVTDSLTGWLAGWQTVATHKQRSSSTSFRSLSLSRDNLTLSKSAGGSLNVCAPLPSQWNCKFVCKFVLAKSQLLIGPLRRCHCYCASVAALAAGVPPNWGRRASILIWRQRVLATNKQSSALILGAKLRGKQTHFHCA